MQTVDATKTAPSVQVSRGMRWIALLVALPATLIVVLMFGLAVYTRDEVADYVEYLALTQIAQAVAALAIGWCVFWITLSWVVRGFMKE